MKNQPLALSFPGANGTPQVVQAPSGIPTGGLSGDGGKIIGFGITLFLIVCVILALAFLVWGGLNWIMSEGDKTKLESARKTLIWAVVGLMLTFVSFFLVSLFGHFFGIDILNVSL